MRRLIVYTKIQPYLTSCKRTIPQSILEMGDLAGNDIGYLIRKEKGLTSDPKTGKLGPARTDGLRYTELGDQLVTKLGRAGQKVSKVRTCATQ